MYEQKVGRAYKRGCLATCLVQIVGGVLGILLVASVLWLIDGGSVAPRSPRFTLALALPILITVVPVVLGYFWIASRGRRLDRAFQQFDWRGRQFGPVLRAWQGVFEGREVQVWFSRGPMLEIYVDCAVGTRGVIHEGGALIRAVGKMLDSHEPLDPPPLEIEGVSFVAHDEGWMRRLFERSAAESAVRALTVDDARSSSVIHFGPKSIRFSRRFLELGDVRAGNVRGWLGESVRLARAVDEIGASSDALEPTRLETWARYRRGQYLNRFLIGTGVVFVLAQLALFVFGWLRIGQP
jgi:hypothetical protein